jgi:hypothetical protein
MLKRTIIILAILGLARAGLAETAGHPLAMETLSTPASLGLDSNWLQWGSTSVSYSSSWMGGDQSSLGLLTKDLRVPLGRNLDFNARFGLAFSPGAGLGNDQGATRLVLPYAALDWRPSENTRLHIEFSQGTGNGFGYAPYSPLSSWAGDPWAPGLSLEDED